MNSKQTRKRQIYDNQRGVCAGCGFKMPISKMTIDHYYPKSKGGNNSRFNTQLLCLQCNQIKGDGTMKHLKEALRDRGMLKGSQPNPRFLPGGNLWNG